MIRTIAAALLAGCFGGMVDSVHEDTALGYLQSIHWHLSLGTDVDSRDKKGSSTLNLPFVVNFCLPWSRFKV